MSARTLSMDDRLHAYLLSTGVREPEILARLRDETASVKGAGMQLSPEQGQLMALLVELIGAERCIEVGTFTGYSALAVALALPDHGRIIACDVSDEWTSIGRRFWAEAGVAHKIDLRLAPATETLQGLIDAGEAGTWDFAFIDADKGNYPTYYEQVLTLLRPGGLLLIDNTLWSGAVADPDNQKVDTLAIRALNEKVHGDERVSMSMVPIGDGATLVRKR